MSKKIIHTLLLCLLFATAATAQKNQGVIKLNPIGFAFGIFDLGYEHKLSERSSFEGSLSYASRNLRLLDLKYNFFGVGAAYRYYLTKKDFPVGFYASPQARFSSGSFINFGSPTEKFAATTIGLVLGYQIVYFDVIALDIGIGPGYVISGLSPDAALLSPGIAPIFNFKVGYFIGSKNTGTKK